MGTDNGKAAPATVRPFDYLGSCCFVYAPGGDPEALNGALRHVRIPIKANPCGDFAHTPASGPKTFRSL
jgi:hypothetical protein